jgi:hypothetical protein
MARSYANIVTAIWRDPDWRRLDSAAQRVYMLLVTQPNISAAGMLPMTIGRWSAMAADTTPEEVRGALVRLAADRWVALDEVTEELLVRSFVRHDNGYRNSKRRPVIRDAAGEIESRTLRQVLAVELVRLELPAEWTGEAPRELDSPSDALSGSPSDGVTGAQPHGIPQAAPKPSPSDSVGNPVDNAFPQVDSLSDALSDGTSASERVVVTRGTYVEPPTHNPQTTTPVPPPTAAPRGARGQRGTRLPVDFTVTDEMKTWFAANCPGVDGRRETEKFRNYWTAKTGKDATKLDWPATWRNWMLKAAENSPGRRPTPALTGANRHIDRRDDNPFRSAS